MKSIFVVYCRWVNEDNVDDKQRSEEALEQRKQSLEKLMIPFSRQG